MKAGLFTNIQMNEDIDKKRNNSISSLKSLKLKQLKRNPNINKISNLSRIYTQNNSALSRNIIKSISPSIAGVKFINSVGAKSSSKKSRECLSNKSGMFLDKNVCKNRSPQESSASKKINQSKTMIHVEESFSASVNSLNKNREKIIGSCQKVRRGLSTSLLDEVYKDMSFVSFESNNFDFKVRVAEIFEKFKGNHYEIIKKFRE